MHMEQTLHMNFISNLILVMILAWIVGRVCVVSCAERLVSVVDLRVSGVCAELLRFAPLSFPPKPSEKLQRGKSSGGCTCLIAPKKGGYSRSMGPWLALLLHWAKQGHPQSPCCNSCCNPSHPCTLFDHQTCGTCPRTMVNGEPI